MRGGGTRGRSSSAPSASSSPTSRWSRPSGQSSSRATCRPRSRSFSPPSCDLSAEISKLLTAKPDVVFHSLWGTDLASVNSQGRVRGLFRQSLVVHNNSAFLFKEFRDLPDGFVVGFRGTHWPEVPDPARNPLQKEFVERCTKKFGEPCGSPHGSYHMVQALQAVKAAYEKAIKATGRWPSVEDVVRAFEYLEFDSPSGRIAMAVGGGHQAIEDSLYGTVKLDAQ